MMKGVNLYTVQILLAHKTAVMVQRYAHLSAVLADVLVRHWGFGVGEVAGYFRRDPTTIISLVSRFADKMRNDSELRKETERLAEFV